MLDSFQPRAGAPCDGRQSKAALAIWRGVRRVLRAHGLECVTELALASGRRADVVGLAESGEVWIIEIKSSLEDYRADQKWPEYRAYCDRLFFAVAPAFPVEILPQDAGLIVADPYGGEIVRPAPEHKLSGARRKALATRFARVAAARLCDVLDPEARLEAPWRV
jgi:hypothetical protein